MFDHLKDGRYARVDFASLFGKSAVQKQAGVNFFACITLKNAGSMRFRWNETNAARNLFFESLGIDSVPDTQNERKKNKRAVPLELIHSKNVFCAENERSLLGARGDGIITANASIVPVITVADCAPIFFANYKARCFGVLHSGWKGTGIVLEAFEKAKQVYGAQKEDFFVIVGPHIQSCCYTVPKDRAEYFEKNFSPRCVEQKNGSYHLSLKAANSHILAEYGIPQSHIAFATDCSSCDARLGSFRREQVKNNSLGENQFTPMAAFVMADEAKLAGIWGR